MTERDKRLVVFLIIFLILVGFIMLVGLPQLERISEQMQQLDEATTLQTDIQQKAASLTNIKEKSAIFERDFAGLTDDFFPLQQTQQIESQFTGRAMSHHLTVQMFNVGEITTPPELLPYVGSAMANQSDEELDGTTVVDENVGSQVGSNYENIGQEDMVSSNNQGIDDSGMQDLIYQSKVTIALAGNDADVQAFLDEMFELSGVLVTGWRLLPNQSNSEVEVDSYQVELMISMAAK